MPFLDSTIIVDYLRNIPDAVNTVQGIFSRGEKLRTTVFNYFEIYFGVLAFRKNPDEAEIARSFLETLEIVSPTVSSIQKSALLKLKLQKKGRLIGLNDLYIAGIVLEYNDILYTQNAKHFSLIPGLKIRSH